MLREPRGKESTAADEQSDLRDIDSVEEGTDTEEMVGVGAASSGGELPRTGCHTALQTWTQVERALVLSLF